MSVILFLAILVVLIVVHELGHFFVAKLFKVRVDEFGVGYPPRAYILGKIGETMYSLNWLPFGGFVRIFGESKRAIEEDSHGARDAKRAMVNKSKLVQAAILSAGVICNLLFAWLLLAVVFMAGTPTAVSEHTIGDTPAKLMVSTVVETSPADAAGFAVGDEITAVHVGDTSVHTLTPSAVATFVQEHAGNQIDFTLIRMGVDEPIETTVVPMHGIITDAPGTPAIGVRMVLTVNNSLPFHAALWQSAYATGYTFWSIVLGIGVLVTDIVAGSANWANIAGPVGIAQLAGDASSVGWLYFMQFTALISINLAVINLLPIPALDGGRLVFVAIEAVSRRPISDRIAGMLNFIGFSLVILLMLAVTYHDIIRLLN